MKILDLWTPVFGQLLWTILPSVNLFQ